MARVFIVEPTTKDIRRARAFGEVQHLFPNNADVTVFDTEEYLHEIKRRLDSYIFDHENDYFLSVGPTIAVNFAFFVLANAYPSVNILLFQANAQDYVLRTLDRISHYAT